MLKIIYGDVPQAVDSKALGVIPVTKLSGGTKTLLLILNEPEKIFNAFFCVLSSRVYNAHLTKLLDTVPSSFVRG